MTNPDVTFLEEKHIFGDQMLETLKKNGLGARPTDLAVILGAFRALKDPNALTGYWSASADADGYVVAVD